MKILYGIQGTGHGHISRARELLPVFSKQAEIDVLISGYNIKLSLEGYHVIRKRGVSFKYDSQGYVDVLSTAMEFKPFTLMKDIGDLDLDQYDIVISDFEPITAWACSMQSKDCVGLSHQAAFHSKKCPRPEKEDLIAEKVMKYFAPCSSQIGFHFKRYDHFIEPPIIRKDIRDLNPTQGEHITCYLPAFHHETLMEAFAPFKDTQWHIFSAYSDERYEQGNAVIHPVSHEEFLASVEGCRGVVTSGGFETCAESMFLNKKLIVMPIRNQYEQLCNVAALKEIGIPVLSEWDEEAQQILGDWLRDDHVVDLPEYADSQKVVDHVIEEANL